MTPRGTGLGEARNLRAGRACIPVEEVCLPSPEARSAPTIRRAAAGDEAARRALLEAHGPLVWSLCRRLTDDPEDAYQDVWAKVFGALARFDPDGPATLRTWIATLTNRTLIDRHRRRTTRGTVVPLEALPPVDPDIDDRLATRQRIARLETAIGRLPESQRRVVVMHHLHGRALAELARDEGVAVGTIKSRLHRGRARLAQLLETP